jgi:hypothetical protein
MAGAAAPLRRCRFLTFAETQSCAAPTSWTGIPRRAQAVTYGRATPNAAAISLFVVMEDVPN